MWKEFKEFALRGNVVDMAVVSLSGRPLGPSSGRWWMT